MIDPVQDDSECPVPDAWRGMLKTIADAFVAGTLPLGPGIRAIDGEVATINAANIAAYPDPIGPLREASWTTSIHARAEDHWHVLIDLSTAGGETSDLVMHVRVFETADSVEFEPGLIYVP